MKKKIYEKPSVKVVKLQASVAMLTGSDTGDTTLNNYNYDSTADED